MDNIAQQAGLSKAALYLYYKSKDAIISALLHYFLPRKTNVSKHSSRPTTSALSVNSSSCLRTSSPPLYNKMEAMQPIAFEFYAVAGRRKEMQEFLAAFYHSYLTRLAMLNEHGIEQGEFLAVDPDAVAITLVALYEGPVLLFFVDPQSISWAYQTERSVRYLLDGIQKREEPDR